MSDEKLQTIVDCFEFIGKESSLPVLLHANVPESVSTPLSFILSMFQSGQSVSILKAIKVLILC